jgi:uroporphyrinogen-III synthase
MRALVTRPRAEAEALAALLAQRGIDAVVEPLIAVADSPAALPDFAAAQAILCTSANGVGALARASKERRVPIFAVGDATAARARAEGFAHVESAGGDVADLAFLVGRRLQPQGGPLFHVAGGTVAGDLAGMLGAEGFTVERVTLYAAEAVDTLTPHTARLIAEGQVDLALFFSPRTSAIFVRLVEAAEVDAGLRATVAVSISAAAAAALADLPFRERLIARAPSQAALLELIDQRVVR